MYKKAFFLYIIFISRFVRDIYQFTTPCVSLMYLDDAASNLKKKKKILAELPPPLLYLQKTQITIEVHTTISYVIKI